jgi:hypothetical protein
MVGLAEEQRRFVLEQLAFSLMLVPEADPTLCVTVLGDRVERPLWNRQHLEGRFECLRRASHPLAARAEDDLIEYLASATGELLPEPPTAGARRGSGVEEPPTASGTRP